MKLVFCCVILLSASPSLGAPSEPTPSEAPQETTPADSSSNEKRSDEQSLEEAVELYLFGDTEEAERRFSMIVQREFLGQTTSPEVLSTAYVYLGEIQYLRGDTQAAEASFRLALQLTPERKLSSYDHPMEIIGLFELVRSSLETEAADVIEEKRKRLPWWGYMPFGTPQYMLKQNARGALYTTLQTVFAGVSIGAWFAVDSSIRQIDDTRDPDERQQLYDRAIVLRNYVGIPSSAAFYVSWAASGIDAGIAWRKRPDLRLRFNASIAPYQDGGMLWLSGEF